MFVIVGFIVSPGTLSYPSYNFCSMLALELWHFVFFPEGPGRMGNHLCSSSMLCLRDKEAIASLLRQARFLSGLCLDLSLVNSKRQCSSSTARKSLWLAAAPATSDCITNHTAHGVNKTPIPECSAHPHPANISNAICTGHRAKCWDSRLEWQSHM